MRSTVSMYFLLVLYLFSGTSSEMVSAQTITRGSVIVIPAAATAVEQFAASECQSHLYRMMGVTVPLISEIEERNAFAIHIGRTSTNAPYRLDQSSKFEGADGFRIVPRTNGISIIGADDLGTLYGVYAFLESQGFRWYTPNPMDHIIPKHVTLTLPAEEVISVPDFPIRWIHSDAWALQNRMNAGISINQKPVGVRWTYPRNSIALIVDPEQYFDDHPEWYALVDGERRRPEYSTHDWQVSTTNTEMIRHVAEHLRQKFEKEPKLDIISLGPNSGGGWCESSRSRAMDDSKTDWWGRFSNRIHVFNNAVARLVRMQFPDRLIKTAAIANYLRYPTYTGYMPQDNLAVQLHRSYSCYTHSLLDFGCTRNQDTFTEELLNWSDHSSHLFVFEYYEKGVWDNLPWPLIQNIREEIPFYKGMGVEGFYTRSGKLPVPSFQLNLYLAAKLIWDSQADIDTILEDYYRNMYGDVADIMQFYYETYEDAFSSSPVHLAPLQLDPAPVAFSKIYSKELIEQASIILNKAIMENTNPQVHERLVQVRMMQDYTVKIRGYLDAIALPFTKIDLSDYRQVNIAHTQAKKIGESYARLTLDYLQQQNAIPYLSSARRLLKSHYSVRNIPVISDHLRQQQMEYRFPE